MEEAGYGAKASGQDARGGGAQAQGRQETPRGFVVCVCVVAIPFVVL